MDSDVKEEFAAVRADLRGVGEQVTSLSEEIRRVETTLRREILEEGVTTRRHFDVVAESLRDDIRIVAEGLVTLHAKVETMRKT
jgi:hypothetical protein